MLYNFFTLIAVIGVLQGIFFSIIFFSIQHSNKKANIILSLLFLSISISLLSSFFMFSNLYIYVPHFIKIELVLTAFHPILLLMYVKKVIEKKITISIKNILYLIPVGVVFFILLPFWLKTGQEKIKYYQDLLNGKSELIDSAVILLLSIIYWVYFFLINRIIKKYQTNIKNYYSTIDKIDLSWIKIFNIIFLLIVISSFIFTVLVVFFKFPYYFFYILLPALITPMIYFLGTKGLLQKNIYSGFSNEKHSIINNNLFSENEKLNNIFIEINNDIKCNKIFKNPNLSLTYFSKKFTLTNKEILKIIFLNSKKGFSDFINFYRIEEAKNLILNNENKNFNFNLISKEAGFISYEEFEKCFVNNTKITPQEYFEVNKDKLRNRTLLNFGFFLGNFANNYEWGMYFGVKKFIEENNCNLFCFAGCAINSPYYNYVQKNVVYNLANIRNLDGIISVSGTLGTHVGNSDLSEFYKRFSPLPIVSIGMNIKGLSSLTVDNKMGMKELMIHLIKDHGYKRIAFIGGPETNQDAAERLKVYKEALIKFNIPIDENIIVPGTFIASAGSEGIRVLIEERKASFDAVVVANDYMAITAIEELQRRSIQVPSQVAVTGFDDILESRYLIKPLTTVRQPTFELGYNAAKMLYLILNNEEKPDSMILPAKIVKRCSCGCDYFQMNNNTIFDVKKLCRNENKKMTNNLRKEIITFLNDILFDKFSGLTSYNERLKWSGILVNSLFEDINKLSDIIFCNALEQILLDSIKNRIDPYPWDFIIIDFFKKILCYNFKKNELNNINNIFQKSKVLIRSIGIRMQAFPIAKNWKRAIQLNFSCQELISIFQFDKLKEILLEELPKLGIKSCYISIYDKDERQICGEYSRLIFSYESYKLIKADINAEKYNTNDLIMSQLNNNLVNSTLLIKSLYYREDQLGFVIYELDNSDTGILEILTAYLCSALKGINLNEKVQIQSQYLKYTDNNKEKKYYKINISKEKSEEYFRRLLDFMNNEKIYKDSEITLPNLANKLNISRNHLSYVINKFVGSNFYDFINGYRIEEAKSFLKEIESNDISILEVAYNSGFKSKSTFNKIFKRHTKVTPTEFRNIYFKNIKEKN